MIQEITEVFVFASIIYAAFTKRNRSEAPAMRDLPELRAGTRAVRSRSIEKLPNEAK